MAMSPSRKLITLFAFLASVVSIAAMPTTGNVQSAYNLPAPITSLDVVGPEWDGSTAVNLEPRRNTAAYLGTTAAFLGSVVVGTCGQPVVAIVGLAPCAWAIGFSVLGAFVSAAAAVISGTTKRSVDDFDITHAGYFSWEAYPAAAASKINSAAIGGESNHTEDTMLTRWGYAHDVTVNDGLPILVGNTACNETYDACQNLWYSKGSTIDLNGTERTVHRIHVTPNTHDYRNATKTGASTLRSRQTHDDGQNSVSDNEGDTYYGGYVWMEGDETTLAADDNEGRNNFAQDIGNQMASESDKFKTTGVFCMDFDSTTDHSAGSLGYMWYYNNDSEYDSSKEQALLNTCGEEAAD